MKSVRHLSVAVLPMVIFLLAASPIPSFAETLKYSNVAANDDRSGPPWFAHVLISGDSDNSVDSVTNMTDIEGSAGPKRASTHLETYSFVDSWPNSSHNWSVFIPSAIAFGPKGDVYIADAGNDRILKLDPTGKLIKTWGSHGSGTGQFFLPSGIAVDKSGAVYVVDTFNDRVQKFDSDGNLLLVFGGWDGNYGWGPFDWPGAITYSPTGHLVVADTGNNRLERFDTNGKLWAQHLAQFSFPDGVAMAPNGNLYTADTGNDRIHRDPFIWDKMGRDPITWGTSGTGDAQFDFPGAIASDSASNVYVSDMGNNRVQKFDPDGELLAIWGSSGSSDGNFDGPRGLAVDSSGKVYVTDTGHDKIQIFGQGSTISLWPRANQIGFGYWSKLAGTVKNSSGAPVSGSTVYLQYKDGSTWKWLKTVTTNSKGYFQHWFNYEGGTRTYRARHAQTGAYSNKTTVTISNNITAWNNYRPMVRYCQWTKLQGKYGGPNGVYPYHTLFMQRWSGSKWVWQATVETSWSGYYSAWAQVCPTTSFRMATSWSVVKSAPVVKRGTSIAAWQNTKVHASIRDGYRSPIVGMKLHLQKWDGSKWIWLGTCTTSSSGYCNFGSKNPSGAIRVATPGSMVVSKGF